MGAPNSQIQKIMIIIIMQRLVHVHVATRLECRQQTWDFSLADLIWLGSLWLRLDGVVLCLLI